MENQSLKYKLNLNDGKKILKGLLIALAGAGLTYLQGVAIQTDFGHLTDLVMYVVNSVLVNAVTKWLTGEQARVDQP